MTCAEREERRRDLIWIGDSIQQVSGELRDATSGNESNLSWWDDDRDLSMRDDELLPVADKTQLLTFLTEWKAVAEAKVKLHDLTCVRCKPQRVMPYQERESFVVEGLRKQVSNWEKEQFPEWSKIIRGLGNPPFLSQQAEYPFDSSKQPSLARAAEAVTFTASEDYCSIQFGAESYTLTKLAGQIVKVLHEASTQNGRPLSGHVIRRRTQCGKVWDAFRRRDGRRFWARFIKKPDKDTFALRLPQQHSPTRKTRKQR